MATSAIRKQPAGRELKKARIELRVAASEEHDRMVLIGVDREAFLAAVLAPPEPAENLVAALRRHRSVLG